MIEVLLDLSALGEWTEPIHMFDVVAPKSLINEITEAIKGERTYNGAVLDFSGLLYEEKK